MRTKQGAARLKNLSGAEGVFEAIVSIFSNVDLVGDRVLPGAFAGSLDRWKASGDPIPVVWSHRWDDPTAHIGYVLDAAETTEGLWVKAKLDLDEPVGRQVFKLLDERRIREFSFAYDVLSSRPARDGATELLELDLIEVGPTLKGVNPATRLLTVKSSHPGLSPRATRRYVDALAAEWKHSTAGPPTPASVLATINHLEKS